MGMEARDCKALSSTPESRPEELAFVYRPLDPSQHSIRLIRVSHDLSSNGYIQCELRYGSIESEYSCLSYVWGPPSQHWIKIDGRQHSVRDNLLSLLQVVQRKGISKWFWIDALCIDQSNVTERAQQVQKMGLIFSHAAEVISWLGPDELIAEFLRDAPHQNVTMPVSTKFFGSEYWLRAWIIQEIILAQRGTLMAGDTEIAVKDLPDSVKVVRQWMCPPQSVYIWPDCYLSTHDGAIDGDVCGRSLPWLLGRFRYKRCDISHDRVFSLLGLCGDGSDVSVDYHATKEEVAYDIILKCKRSFCLCSIGIICEALDISIKPGRHPEWNYVPTNSWQRIFAQTELPVVWHPTAKKIAKAAPETLLGKRQTIDSDTYNYSDAQLCSMQKCDNLANEPHLHCTSPGNFMDSTISFTIPLEALCERVSGYVTIHAVDGGAWYQYFDTMGKHSKSYFKGPKYMRGHVYNQLSNDQKSCKILFTLEMLLWIHRLSNHLREVKHVVCCERVRKVGVTGMDTLECTVLQFYEK